MTRLADHVFKPWIIATLLFGSILVSASYSLRFYRDSRKVIQRREQTLRDLRRLRHQTAAPASGLQLVSETNVTSPLHDISDPAFDSVSRAENIKHRSIGHGLYRWSLLLDVEGLRAENLGDVLSSLEGVDRGWWITQLTLRASDKGLKGQLKVEALDKSPADQ